MPSRCVTAQANDIISAAASYWHWSPCRKLGNLNPTTDADSMYISSERSFSAGRRKGSIKPRQSEHWPQKRRTTLPSSQHGKRLLLKVGWENPGPECPRHTFPGPFVNEQGRRCVSFSALCSVQSVSHGLLDSYASFRPVNMSTKIINWLMGLVYIVFIAKPLI